LPEPEQAQTPAPAAAAADDRRAAVTDESRMASPAESGTVASPAESGNIAAATFSAVWPPVPNSTASNDPGATITDPGATTTDSPDEADDAVPTEQPADMPLVWPELTDADRTALTDANRAVVMQSSNAAPGIGQLFLFIATLAAFVAVALHAIVKLRKSWVGYRNSPALSQTAQAPVQPMPAIGAPNESDVFARWRASAREDHLRRNSRWERDRSADLTREKRTVAA
jgi:hypothetical protein